VHLKKNWQLHLAKLANWQLHWQLGTALQLQLATATATGTCTLDEKSCVMRRVCQNEMIKPLFIQFESPLISLWGRLVLLSSISSLMLSGVSSMVCLVFLAFLLY
jgi:hypothetical protein